MIADRSVSAELPRIILGDAAEDLVVSDGSPCSHRADPMQGPLRSRDDLEQNDRATIGRLIRRSLDDREE